MFRIFNWTVLLFLAFVLAGRKSGAQDKPVSSAISGAVEDSTGGVIIGAHVTLRNISDEVIASATSNSEGHFSMSDIPSGHYVLEVESGNFQTELMDVVVSPTGTGGGSLLIRMRVASVQQAVNVTATIGDRLTGYTAETATTTTKTETAILRTPLAVQVVTRETLDDRQTFSIVSATTENVSSVFNTPQYYDDIMVRGFDASITTYRNGLIVQAVTDQRRPMSNRSRF